MKAKHRSAVVEWLAGRDTGISSTTMATIALGAKDGRFDAPHDPDDFGRCYRLFKLAPSIEEDFAEIGRLCPPFAPILAAWWELCAIYVRDEPSGRSDELYRRIRDLRDGIPTPGVRSFVVASKDTP